MNQLRTEIVIRSTPEKIWKILTGFNGYRDWNPFIVSSFGKAEKGSRLVNTMKNGESNMTFRPTVTDVQPGRRFEWLGSLFMRGIFDGRHYFEIENLGDGQSRVVQGEYFSGILSGLILKKIGKQTLQGFTAMNEALKTRAETEKVKNPVFSEIF